MQKAITQNGYRVRDVEDTRVWHIPGSKTTVRLDQGWAGFLLVHWATFFNAQIEKIDGKQLDDWGWAVRPVRGQATGYSNHAAGLAIDLNALKHPRGKKASYSRKQRAAMALRLKVRYRGYLRSGEFYQDSPTDGMHTEVNVPFSKLEPFAKKCATSPYGIKILKANPDFAKSHGMSKYLK